MTTVYAKTNRELADQMGTLGHDERRVAGMLVDRLCMGRGNYGEWNAATDRRDFHQEALEEALDLAIYLTMALARMGQERRNAVGGGKDAPEPRALLRTQQDAPGDEWEGATGTPTGASVKP